MSGARLSSLREHNYEADIHIYWKGRTREKWGSEGRYEKKMRGKMKNLPPKKGKK